MNKSTLNFGLHCSFWRRRRSGGYTRGGPRLNVKVFLKRRIRIITTVCLQLHKELTGYSRQGLNVVETHLTAVHHRLHLHTSTAGYTATGPSFSKGGQHYPLDKCFLTGYCNIIGSPNTYNCYINHYNAIWGFLSTVKEFLPTRAILLYAMCCSTSLGNHECTCVLNLFMEYI